MVSSVTTSKRGRKDFVTPKVVATLDRCQLSIRDSVYILQAVVEALDLSCDEFPINKSSKKNIKIRLSGAMHQARWMARTIYSLKICLLQSQFKISAKDKRALQDICLFIAVIYVKPWIGCSLTVKAPNQALRFLKSLKEYETVNKEISKAALSKFSQHLWYLSEEIAVLSLFDDEIDEQTKTNIVANLQRDSLYDSVKRYIPSKEDMSDYLYGK
ncbi:uncharacterized protein LOC131855700 [Achroia grisella]|uniref:uncharacterized protein LOC131855700 n=1 Tax=Achroia grisella TaxID=688607 RepID=UPI0027D28A65|nr:uncharacterized protein LOC131855700 [Achroia grisella]